MAVKIVVQSITDFSEGTASSGGSQIQLIGDYLSPISNFNTAFNTDFKNIKTKREAILDVLGKVDELADQIKAGVVEAKKDFGT
jgi:hypothetical protein